VTDKPIRVLVVDDSAFARKVVRDLLARAHDVEVVGHARDGLDALEQIERLRPDVVTLDLQMPELDGIGVLTALAGRPDAPRVIVVSASAADSDLALEALQLGAMDLVHKPSALATDRLYEIDNELLEKLRIAGSSAGPGAGRSPRSGEQGPPRAPGPIASVVVLGTSTGGPQALTHVLGSLPRDMPAPVAAVVHIPAGYTAALAERLDRRSGLHIVEASEGLIIEAGMAAVARAGVHLRLERAGERAARCRLDPQPMSSLHRPSVDVLFTSAVEAFGAETLGVVMTGMGDDGLAGSRAIRAAGGRVLTEHPDSCVVDGMPRVVREAGLSDGEAVLKYLPATIRSWI
jgi:two-component system chemotaxis response regulator CheB